MHGVRLDMLPTRLGSELANTCLIALRTPDVQQHARRPPREVRDVERCQL